MKTLLLVDDQPAERRLLYHALKQDFRVLEAGDAEAALACVRRGEVDLVVLDLHLPPSPETPEQGVRVLHAIREASPLTPVVITTGDRDRGLALEMVRRGVADFLVKPVDPDILKIVVARSLGKAELERELEVLRRASRERSSFGGLIGRSAAMREMFGRLEKLARTPAPVLLLGESGTGKSAVARALHYEGPRAGRPFVVVDGAAIPESLVESELFGHVRGAFTGAEADRAGRVQLADGGTLFLDEIGNLSPAAQAKLLLFLDDHSFTPVGSTRPARVDVRLVAATNRQLEPLVREGTFRADLLYRIQGVTVTVPPLRERREDVAVLAEYFVSRIGKDWGRPGARLTPEALALLAEHDWPGNVRQLEHALESSLALADSEALDSGDLVLPARSSPESGSPAEARGEGARQGGALKERVAAFEREVVARALEETRGNKAAAARRLGLDEHQIHYLCRKHRLG